MNDNGPDLFEVAREAWRNRGDLLALAGFAFALVVVSALLLTF